MLETELHDIKGEMTKLSNEAYLSGDHLRGAVFFPEYIGFEETLVENQFGGIDAKIYTKNGWNIARPISLDEKRWFILAPGEKSPIKMLITDMYNGIVILAAAGMNISIDDYFEENRKIEQKLLDNIEDGLEGLRSAELGDASRGRVEN